MFSFTFIVFQRATTMSNSNYNIGLQRLKPVHNAYCGLLNLAENWSWARDVNGRERDETVTLTIFLEMRPRRDVGTSRDSHSLESRDRDVETETTTLVADDPIFEFPDPDLPVLYTT